MSMHRVASKFWRFARWPAAAILVVLLLFLTVTLYVWLGSREYQLNSVALDETRTYRVFSEGSGSDKIIYSFDGDKFRHGLVPASFVTIAAFLRGEEAPALVAVYSNKNRDIDFRPSEIQPLSWRPVISGRSDSFDRFLLEELLPEVENGWSEAPRRYLFGHSLAGLYVLDLTSWTPDMFDGVFAFSPTFSHDYSMQERIVQSCANAPLIYANIGLESGRDTLAFSELTEDWQLAEPCIANPPVVRQHFGVIHPLIMTTGQAEAAIFYLH